MKELIDEKENNMAIVMSIKPEWCDKIFSGEKEFELRKTVPAHMPAKVYVYKSGSGTVIGEFMLKYYVKLMTPREYMKIHKDIVITDLSPFLQGTCLTEKQFLDYLGNAKYYYAIRIEDPVLYKTPIPLNKLGLSRPPQSWCYAKNKPILKGYK